ncbi:MAG TPA: DUF3488 and DUF4129 domain-containing transglutaminase family protein [Acidobacteriota bacterium]
MNLHSIHRLTLLAQSLLALAALAAAGGLPKAAVAALGSGILLAERLPYERRTRPGFRQALALLSILASAFLILDLAILSERFVLALAHLLPYLLFHKHLERIRERDTWQILLVAALHPVAAAGLSDDLAQLPFLFAYVAAAIAALIAFELKRSAAPQGRPRALLSPPVGPTGWKMQPLGRAEIGAWVRALLLAAGFTVVGFIALPRFQVGLMAGALGRSEMRAGLTSRVELNQVGWVMEREQPVLQIRCKVPPLPSTLWRSVVLEVFDGQRWMPAGVPRRWVERPDGWLELIDAPHSGRLMEINVTLLPGAGPELVAAADWVGILKPRSGALVAVPGEGFRLEQAQRPASYRALSRLRDGRNTAAPGFEPEPAGAEFSEWLESKELQRCLRLPRVDPAVARLLESLQAGRPAPHVLAERIQRRLGTLRYTSRIQRDFHLDPTADFLFNQRAGHCEHFASAMAVLLRAARVPARLVNGYRLGSVDPTSGAYHISQADAHTWVEAFLPGPGWVEFDPSPLAADANAGSAWWIRLEEWANASWDRYVILFDRERQRALADWLIELASAHPVPLLALLALLAVPQSWIRRARRALRSQPPLERCWSQLERGLNRRGIRVAASETLANLADRLLRQDRQAALAVAQFRELYEPIRFGTAIGSPQRLAQIRKALSLLD